jgi:hypothetical protein
MLSIRLLPLIFATLFVTSAFAVNACKPPMESQLSIDQPKALVFAAARSSLVLLDAAETYYLDSIKEPTNAQLDASAERIEKLKAARAALERVRLHLSGEVTSDLKSALVDMKVALTSAQAFGVKVRPEAVAALNTLEEFLR